METVLRALVEAGKSTREIAAATGLNQTGVRRQLRKFGLKTQLRECNARDHRCSICGESDPKNFYGDDKGYCKKCHGQYYAEKARQLKRRAVESLGGRCVCCGFNEYICSLDFHHTDPDLKDINFRSKGGWSWERLKKELETCVLLCKNCHAAIHAGLLRLPD